MHVHANGIIEYVALLGERSLNKNITERTASSMFKILLLARSINQRTWTQCLAIPTCFLLGLKSVEILEQVGHRSDCSLHFMIQETNAAVFAQTWRVYRKALKFEWSILLVPMKVFFMISLRSDVSRVSPCFKRFPVNPIHC